MNSNNMKAESSPRKGPPPPTLRTFMLGNVEPPQQSYIPNKISQYFSCSVNIFLLFIYSTKKKD